MANYTGPVTLLSLKGRFIILPSIAISRLGISLDPQEAKWISNTMRGGLIWAIGLY
ncbi:4026_t:CDS:2 [Entrophospora sp. SA101]|nr:4026_t:CDS:2 [Entrophospora sp. SA101]CAJ0837068.1 932_t:CDS:2 [Entrophospora sp. SA101]